MRMRLILHAEVFHDCLVGAVGPVLVKEFRNNASFFVFLALVLVNDVERSPVAIDCDLHCSAPFVIITALRVITSACFHDAEHAASAFCQSSHVFALVDSEVFHDCFVGAVDPVLVKSPELRLCLLQKDGVLHGLLAQFCQLPLHLRIVILES